MPRQLLVAHCLAGPVAHAALITKIEHDVYAAVKAVDWPGHFKVERTLRVA